MELNYKFNRDGLIPAILQDSKTGRVLMMAWMNAESLGKTFETGLMHYWSRSRKKLWLKGETSGNTQKVVKAFIDCDADTLLFEIDQTGGACHAGFESCFFQPLNRDGSSGEILEKRLFDPSTVYAPKL